MCEVVGGLTMGLMHYVRCEYVIQTSVRSFSDELSGVVVRYMDGVVE
jgi:hypothetical protein